VAASGVTPTNYKPSDKERDCIGLVNDRIAEAMRWHRTFASRVELRYAAWRAMAPENSPKTWRSNLHPPHLISIVEGMISSMEEAQPTWKVRGRALPGMSMEEAVAQSERAEINQQLLTHQMRVDRFAGKQRPWIQQDLIAGFTPGKIFWLREQKDRRYLSRQDQLVYDEGGGTIDMANVLDERSQVTIMRDDPTFEPRDVRDFLYPESATSLEKAPWVIDRTFVTFQTLEKMEKLSASTDNVEYLKETRAHDTHSRGPDIVAEREQRLRNVDRTRGLVELVELWSDDRVITVANRSVVVHDEPNPFWHGGSRSLSAPRSPTCSRSPACR
jgi:hypothetical protein